MAISDDEMQEEMMFMSLDHILIECIILQIKFHSILSKAFFKIYLNGHEDYMIVLTLVEEIESFLNNYEVV